MKLTDSALDLARPHVSEGITRTAVGSKDQRNGNRGVVESQQTQTGFAFIICGSEIKYESAPNHATGLGKRKTKRVQSRSKIPISSKPAVRNFVPKTINLSVDYKLYAANGTEIKTYGLKTLVVNLDLRRSFHWRSASFRKSKTSATGPLSESERGVPDHDGYECLQTIEESMGQSASCRPEKRRAGRQVRPCGDYSRLNAVTKPDRYCIPRLQDFIYILTKKKILSRIDINRDYHHIPIHEKDIEKTAIIIPFGLFDFPRITFGLRNAVQTFQRFLNHTVLQVLDFLFAYIDDIIIEGDHIDQHRSHLKALFSRLDTYGMTINLSKCAFEKDKIDFLGYEVSTSGISPLEEKLKAIVAYPRQKTIVELRRILGMLNF
ncbi:hypothetical protein EVAR_66585_1 [Eumeta japonica]|uniref:Reverse transcriptase domain-containing protein n=1 Tax=Eumeta variegata TaxID=151549 RepID=A0A4C1Z7N5_EUMVA|nr:hypothetical protein EVAR_66585_1 [Eumeta japonica]